MTGRVRELVAERRDLRGALLPVLHAVHAEVGVIGADEVREIAEELNLSRAEVHGVVTFYRDFQGHEDGVPVRICLAEACRSVGAEELLAHARERRDADPGTDVRVGTVSCLGNCALGPAVQVAGRLHGRVDATRLDALLERSR